MAPFPDFAVRQLQRSDVPLMGSMMTMFGDAFKEADTYTGAPPSAAYLKRLLARVEWVRRVARLTASRFRAE